MLPDGWYYRDDSEYNVVYITGGFGLYIYGRWTADRVAEEGWLVEIQHTYDLHPMTRLQTRIFATKGYY